MTVVINTVKLVEDSTEQSQAIVHNIDNFTYLYLTTIAGDFYEQLNTLNHLTVPHSDVPNVGIILGKIRNTGSSYHFRSSEIEVEKSGNDILPNEIMEYWRY